MDKRHDLIREIRAGLKDEKAQQMYKKVKNVQDNKSSLKYQRKAKCCKTDYNECGLHDALEFFLQIMANRLRCEAMNHGFTYEPVRPCCEDQKAHVVISSLIKLKQETRQKYLPTGICLSFI